jgi:hypothetical protein
MKKSTLLMMFITVSCLLYGNDFNVALWRGETMHIRIPDNVVLEKASADTGIKIRQGRIKAIRYLPDKYHLEYKYVADKVVWGDESIDGPIVLEISASKDAKPGVYKFGYLKVRVVDRVLPPASEWKFILDLWQHPWAIARIHDVKPFSRKFWKVARPVYETLATAGQKFITTTLIDYAWNHQCYDAYFTMVRHIKCKDGSWKFDYEIFDKYVEFAKSCGIGPYISCYTLCPWGNILRWEDEDGNAHSVVGPAGSKEYEQYWGPFLKDFTKHLKEKGWFENTYIAMDERSPEEIKIIADFVQKNSPGMKISLAGNRPPSDFKGTDIDCYSQIIYDIDKQFLSEVAERKKKGWLTTFYVCMGPKFPNTFFTSKEDEAYWLGYYSAAIGLDGFLRWAWNSWGRNPDVDGTYTARVHFPQGDTHLCYPDGAPSWRFLKLRQGIVAAEKSRILKEMGLYDEELKKQDAKYVYEHANAKFSFKALVDMTAFLLNRDEIKPTK